MARVPAGPPPQELCAASDPEGAACATRDGPAALRRGLLAVLHVRQAPEPRCLPQQRGTCSPAAQQQRKPSVDQRLVLKLKLQRHYPPLLTSFLLFQVFFHGEPIPVTVTVTNNTEKTVKKIKVLGRTLSSELEGRVLECLGSVWSDKALLGPWNSSFVSVVRGSKALEGD